MIRIVTHILRGPFRVRKYDTLNDLKMSQVSFSPSILQLCEHQALDFVIMNELIERLRPKTVLLRKL